MNVGRGKILEWGVWGRGEPGETAGLKRGIIPLLSIAEVVDSLSHQRYPFSTRVYLQRGSPVPRIARSDSPQVLPIELITHPRHHGGNLYSPQFARHSHPDLG
jgi:hypothetical protein